MDLTLTEILIVCGSLFLIALLVSEILEWLQMIIPLMSNNHDFVPILDYTNDNPPHIWQMELIPEKPNNCPINIITHDSVVIEASDPLKWIGYSTQPAATTLMNNGKTISLQFTWSRGILPCIEGGPLKKSYNFHSIIFHWGQSNNIGSEHAFDNVEYPLEMQLVHVKADLESLNTRQEAENTDEIAIISFVFECSEIDNHRFENIISNWLAVEDVQSKISITPINLNTFFPQFKNKFYAYNGSSAAFSGNVTWIIYPEPLNISKTQMNEFRKINSTKSHVIDNSQLIQTLNERIVYFHE